MANAPAARASLGRRPIVLLVLAAVLGGVVLWASSGAGARSPEQRAAVARELADDVHLSVVVRGAALAATKAFADFGLEEGVRLVLVRILDEISLELRIVTTRDIVLAGPPRVCLVGPAWAPDDAGLSDRCWGEPDLAALVAGRLVPDSEGRFALAAERPVVLDATVQRGDERCDYRPGTWELELAIEPLVDGRSAGLFELQPARLEVPLEPDGTALPFVALGVSRYCGLAATVWREQGEPALLP